MEIQIPLDEERRLLETLAARTDAEADRIRRYLAMPDLSRTPGSPIHEIVERVMHVPSLTDFDVITIPEVVPTTLVFDLFDFADDHPARSPSDTYYIDKENVLRPHDTVFWYYYLNHPDVRARIERKEALGALCYGKVYRKDEVDSRHMNVFHQLGGWYIVPQSTPITPDDLQKVLTEIAQNIFGPETKIRFNADNFPYTDPSFEVEVNVAGTAAEGPARGEWLEILGCGMPKQSVLKKVGVEGYHGWAFGFGIERLAIISMALPDIRLLWSTDERIKKQLRLGQVYHEVSKYPPVVRDISFVVPKTFVPNDYFDLVRETIGDDLAEEISLIDQYENDAKFGADKKSYAYRITYRSLERTLTSEEVDRLHKKLEIATASHFSATVR